MLERRSTRLAGNVTMTIDDGRCDATNEELFAGGLEKMRSENGKNRLQINSPNLKKKIK